MKVLKTFVVISLVLLCFVWGRTDAHAETTVYDADGQFLGTLLEVSYDRADIYMPSLGKITSVSIFDGNIVDSSFYFESSDCTGVPYAGPATLYMIVKNGNKFYTGENVAPSDVHFNSYLEPDGSCSSANTTRTFIPLQEVSQPPISLPVTLPLSLEYEPPHPGKWKK